METASLYKHSLLWAIFSFGITILRLVAALSCCLLLLYYKEISALFCSIIVILIMVFDHIDGKFFKKSYLNEITFWKNARRVIDSVSDRLCIQLFCIPILLLDITFLPIYCIVLCKEMLTSIYCIQAYYNGVVLSSNSAGKISSIATGLSVILWLMGQTLTVYCMLFVVIVFGFIAHRRYKEAYRKSLLNESI